MTAQNSFAQAGNSKITTTPATNIYETCVNIYAAIPKEYAPIDQCVDFLNSPEFTALADQDIIRALDLALATCEKLLPCNRRHLQQYTQNTALDCLLASARTKAPNAYQYYTNAIETAQSHLQKTAERDSWQISWRILRGTSFQDDATKKHAIDDLLTHPALAKLSAANPYSALDIKIAMAAQIAEVYRTAFLHDVVFNAPEWTALSSDGIGGQTTASSMKAALLQTYKIRSYPANAPSDGQSGPALKP